VSTSGLSSHVWFVIACSACHQPGVYVASIFGMPSVSRCKEFVMSLIRMSSACHQPGVYVASIFGLTSMSRHDANVTSMIEHEMVIWRIVAVWSV
jgi:hypothetical protein